MTNEPTPILPEELHAYIDGELDATRAAEITRVLERDKILAARAAAFRADKAALTAAYGALAAAPLPQAWRDQIARKSARRPLTQRRAMWAGAAAAMLIAITLAWQFVAARNPGDRIVAEALAARDDRLSIERIVPVSALSENGAPNQLVSGAIGSSVKIPDLSRMNFHLQSVKIYSGAVELDYRDGQDRLFTIYLRQPEGSERFDQFQRGPLRVCVWQDDALGAVMSGPISGAEMMRLAALAYSGLVA